MSDGTDEINSRLQALRTIAEEQLVSTEPVKKPMLTKVSELLHEVSVYQIALEMQNKELCQANIDLEALHKHYIDLYDLAPIGYLTLNEEGVIVEINLTGAGLLGIDRMHLINRHFELFVADEFKDLWSRHFMLTKQKVGKFGCELPYRHEKGITLFLHVDCIYGNINSGSGQFRITLTDVTERKQSEEALRIASVAFETQEGMIVTDAHKVILRVNKAFTRITGYSDEDAIGKNPKFLYSGLHGEDFYTALWAAVERDRFWQGEIWDKRKNGEIFPVWQTITAVIDADGAITHYISAISDITVQKQAEKILLETHQLLENQVATSKEELERIKEDTEKVNHALNVLLKHRETEISVTQLAFSDEVEATIVPLIKQLKTTSSGRVETIRLINILEDKLQQLVKSYGHTVNLATAYKKLTPIETQVASMVRQGISSKVIAAALNVSTATINVHRKHIRKKLKLNNESINLYSYLQSLTE